MRDERAALGGGEDIDPRSTSFPVAVAGEATQVLAGNRAGIGVKQAGEMLLQVVARFFVEGLLTAKPKLAAAGGRGVHTQGLIAGREVQRIGLWQVVKKRPRASSNRVLGGRRHPIRRRSGLASRAGGERGQRAGLHDAITR